MLSIKTPLKQSEVLAASSDFNPGAFQSSDMVNFPPPPPYL